MREFFTIKPVFWKIRFTCGIGNATIKTTNKKIVFDKRFFMDYMVNKKGTKVLIEADPVAIKKQVVGQYKEMRKEKKLSQEQVAAAAGMARPDISRFESGRYNPSLELMVRYAHALGCELKVELVSIDKN